MVCTIAIAISLAVLSAGCTRSTNTTSPTPSVSTHVAVAGAVTSQHAAMIRAPRLMAVSSVTYQNPALLVTFTYPQNWGTTPNPTADGSVSDRYYVAWPNNGDNSTYVNFYAWPNTSNDTLSNIVTTDTQSFYQYQGNVTVVQNATSTTLGGMPALTTVLSYDQGKDPAIPVEANTTYTTNYGWVYVIQYTASPSYYAGSLNAVQQVTNSFAFL